MVTTDLLSPNKKDLAPMGAPKYLKFCLMSIICSVVVLAATNSEPYVAVSTVACFLKYQSTGVLLTKWRYPVQDLPVAMQWFKLGSMVVVVVTASPSGSGMSSGRISWTLPYTEYVQTKSWLGRKE